MSSDSVAQQITTWMSTSLLTHLVPWQVTLKQICLVKHCYITQVCIVARDAKFPQRTLGDPTLLQQFPILQQN